MKKIFSAIYIFLLLAGLGCGKESADPPKEITTKFPPPAWKANDTGKYPATMTAVVTLPSPLATDALENDNLAAFIGDECRGVGVVIDVNSQKLFFVLIQGMPDESNKITFKYYSIKTSFMYESRTSLNFLVDDVYGTAGNPKTIDLEQLK
jgi:hypothetical protein